MQKEEGKKKARLINESCLVLQARKNGDLNPVSETREERTIFLRSYSGN